MERFRFLVGLLFLGLLTGCKHDERFFPHDMPAQHVEIVRFDSALLCVRTETAKQDIKRLFDDYEMFMPVFTESILGVDVRDTDYLEQALPLFLNDTVYGFRETNLRAQLLFADISDIRRDLDHAFTCIHYLYPDWVIPTVYFFISGFNASVLFVDDDIAVGVDMYLGSDWKYYNQVVYQYQKQTMRKECIAMDVTSAYLFRNIMFNSTKNRLLENMIYRGKVMYLLSLLFPDMPDYEVMGYTEEQWRWCVRNEKAIWNQMMDKKDLFKTESLILSSYLNDGPFTAEVTQDSPGRLGTWIGWRITESYMRHHKDISIQQLMSDGDAAQILQDSYYKP